MRKRLSRKPPHSIKVSDATSSLPLLASSSSPPGSQDSAGAFPSSRNRQTIEKTSSWGTPMRYQRIHVLGGPGSGKTYLSPSVWLRDWRVVKRSAIHLLGKSHAAKKEIFASLLNLIHWNHTYEKNQLIPARALLSHLHKNPVECRTLTQVFAVLADIPLEGR